MIRPLPALLIPAVTYSAHAEVLISEIMYHPASEKPAEEFIELCNTSLASVDGGGWRFTNGVSFTFPSGTLIHCKGNP